MKEKALYRGNSLTTWASLFPNSCVWGYFGIQYWIRHQKLGVLSAFTQNCCNVGCRQGNYCHRLFYLAIFICDGIRAVLPTETYVSETRATFKRAKMFKVDPENNLYFSCNEHRGPATSMKRLQVIAVERPLRFTGNHWPPYVCHQMRKGLKSLGFIL